MTITIEQLVKEYALKAGMLGLGYSIGGTGRLITINVKDKLEIELREPMCELYTAWEDNDGDTHYGSLICTTISNHADVWDVFVSLIEPIKKYS